MLERSKIIWLNCDRSQGWLVRSPALREVTKWLKRWREDQYPRLEHETVPLQVQWIISYPVPWAFVGRHWWPQYWVKGISRGSSTQRGLVYIVELRSGILPLRTGLFIEYPFSLCLCMVIGVYSEYQRRNTLGTAPVIWQRFNSEIQREHTSMHLNGTPQY